MERDNDAVRRDFAGEERVREVGYVPEHAGQRSGRPAGTRGGRPRPSRRAARPWAIRAEDTEPYVALQYVARLFKIVAMVVVVALTAEVVAGVALEGAGRDPPPHRRGDPRDRAGRDPLGRRRPDPPPHRRGPRRARRAGAPGPAHRPKRRGLRGPPRAPGGRLADLNGECGSAKCGSAEANGGTSSTECGTAVPPGDGPDGGAVRCSVASTRHHDLRPSMTESPENAPSTAAKPWTASWSCSGRPRTASTSPAPSGR